MLIDYASDALHVLAPSAASVLLRGRNACLQFRQEVPCAAIPDEGFEDGGIPS